MSSRGLRLLLIEDNPGDVRLLEETLRDTAEFDSADLQSESSLQAGLTRLRAEGADAVLLDLHLPDTEGEETVRRVTEAAPSTPVVALTCSEDRGQARRALRAGAEDYLIKGEVRPSDLERSLRYSLERKRAEVQLRQSERRLRQAEKIAGVGHWEWEVEGGALHWSDQTYRICGYEPGEIDPTFGRFMEMVLPDDRERIKTALERALAGEEEYDVEHRLRRPDGEVRWIREQGEVARDEKGEPVRMLGVARDITKEKRREEALMESERRFRQMAENIDEVFWLRDPEAQEILYVSPASEEVWGMPPKELKDDLSAWLEVVHPEDRERIRGVVFDEQYHAFQEEYRLIHPDGEVRWVRDQAFPVRNEDGEVCRVAGVTRDVTERRRLEEELRHRALHDSLTGLPNRVLLEDRLEQAVGQAKRRSEAAAVVMTDLERFKRINDSLGHTAGDRVLQEVAHRIEESVRSEDTVARWGGDEFCVLLKDLGGEEDLKTACRRLRRGVRESLQIMGEEIPLEMTLGAVLISSSHPSAFAGTTAPEDLVRYADHALHLAKEKAGCSFHLLQPDRDAGIDRNHELRREQDLRRGLEAEEIEPAYQPIVELTTGGMWGVELLARWRHPERGQVGPGDFIPLAEETGLIHELGRRVLRQACEDLAHWSQKGAETTQVAANISGRQFEAEGFAGEVEDILQESGLDPGRVCFEVTETAIMRATERIDELRDLGIRVLIDDFGTGYSSFLYLRDLDVDGLKIDMSFVQGLGNSAGNEAIIETILTLGDALGVGVIAEGIETDHQLRGLREAGCEFGQGFYFARPKTADEMTTYLGNDGSAARIGSGPV